MVDSSVEPPRPEGQVGDRMVAELADGVEPPAVGAGLSALRTPVTDKPAPTLPA